MYLKMHYLIILSLICLAESKIEHLVAGGQVASIEQFPHSALLKVKSREKDISGWICSASIINERILLTAAQYIVTHATMSVFVGHNKHKKGTVSSVTGFIMHKKYSLDHMSHDIALIRLKTDLKFSRNVRRLAIMKSPRFKKAQVAGWGLDENEHQTKTLMYIDQYVWEQAKCGNKTKVRKGVICASVEAGTSHVSRGDTGSALMVQGYIQIGITSYLIPKVSKTMAIYTDTRHFYKWILKKVKILYCK